MLISLQQCRARRFLEKSKILSLNTLHCKGRMDERYDMQRGSKNKRFKYLRYYEPSKPFIQFMNTPESGPLMTELRKAEKLKT